MTSRQDYFQLEGAPVCLSVCLRLLIKHCDLPLVRQGERGGGGRGLGVALCGSFSHLYYTAVQTPTSVLLPQATDLSVLHYNTFLDLFD